MSSRAHVLVLVMAGGAGKRLGALTERRAKPAVPFGGIFRLIDFPLSNCRHAVYSDVWVVQQFNPFKLSDHLANGRPWDLDRTDGGLMVLHPHLGSERGGWHEGTADALWRNADLIREFHPDALLVLSADAVYRLDYRAVVEGHLEAGADVTMVTTRVAEEDAGRYGVVQVARDGRISDYAYKPDDPASDLVANEVFVFRPERTLDLLDELGEQVEHEDFGDDLLPRLVADGGAREHRMDGYWRDVGTVDAYWSAHLDLLGAEPAFQLDDPGWPIYTRSHQRPPARILPGAELSDAYVSPGAVVAGRVERSVLSPGVVVEQGATVVDSVLLHETVVRSGAVVERAVLDIEVEVGAGARVGGTEDVTLVGEGERITSS